MTTGAGSKTDLPKNIGKAPVYLRSDENLSDIGIKFRNPMEYRVLPENDEDDFDIDFGSNTSNIKEEIKLTENENPLPEEKNNEIIPIVNIANDDMVLEEAIRNKLEAPEIVEEGKVSLDGVNPIIVECGNNNNENLQEEIKEDIKEEIKKDIKEETKEKLNNLKSIHQSKEITVEEDSDEDDEMGNEVPNIDGNLDGNINENQPDILAVGNPMIINSRMKAKLDSMNFPKDAENDLSYSKMIYVTSRRHPYVYKKKGIKIVYIGMQPYGVCTNVGSHPCCACSEGSPSMFSKYGIGIVLYFKQFKFLAIITFVMAILAVPAFVYFIISIMDITLGNPTYKNAITVYGINRKSLVKTTFGNLGRGSYACGNGKGGESIHLTCDYGILQNFAVYGYETDGSTCIEDVLFIII